jgi:polyribonucleotide nucleotidyltransferase
MAVHSVSIDFEGRKYTLESGKLAKFSNGAVMVSCGDTMVLVTAVASEKAKEDIDFLPLQVEYREKLSAAGKFPGGFIKRETRPSEKEILTSRLIDRPCRPMFPKNWYYETQIIAQVFSAEPDVDPSNLAAVGASAALLISDIPFNGPISEVRVGRLEGNFIANPSTAQLELCDIDITIAGTDTSIVMVEGESNEISEEDFLAALEYGHEKVKELNNLQKQLLALTSQVKRQIVDNSIPEEFIACIKEAISADLKDYVYTTTTKNERGEHRQRISDKALETATASFGENEEYAGKVSKYAGKVFSKLEKLAMRNMILDDNKRLDGRTTVDIRPISCETGLLPRVHGSSLFTRGETQALVSITLGTSRDEQMVDGLLPSFSNNFYLNYNFPPFSVGETGRFGMQSRREIGHGNLAERSLKKVRPDDEVFPYTIRIISDILESNGSSSMASVCGGSLALFHAGVPMKKAVSGIAMGLIMEGDRVAILSDILGDEDFLGDMDFKVAGSADGITACQMDIKIEGLSMDTMKKALYQARDGRLHILEVMNKTMDKPNEELSQYAPRFSKIQIPQDTIGAVIGTGGETIRSIVKESGADINIEDDGTIIIAATSQESSDLAIKLIKALTRKPQVGEIYTGTIKEIREGLGAFVEILPKTQGLLHISAISYDRTENVADVLTVGEKVEVKLIEVTSDGKYRLSRKALMTPPEGYVEPAPRPPRPDGDRRDSRGGGRDDRRGNDRGRDDRRPGGNR